MGTKKTQVLEACSVYQRIIFGSLKINRKLSIKFLLWSIKDFITLFYKFSLNFARTLLYRLRIISSFAIAICMNHNKLIFQNISILMKNGPHSTLKVKNSQQASSLSVEKLFTCIKNGEEFNSRTC